MASQASKATEQLMHFYFRFPSFPSLLWSHKHNGVTDDTILNSWWCTSKEMHLLLYSFMMNQAIIRSLLFIFNITLQNSCLVSLVDRCSFTKCLSTVHVYHSTFFMLFLFQDLLQTNWFVSLTSSLLNYGSKYKKPFLTIGRDDHVLSLKDINVLLPSVN